MATSKFALNWIEEAIARKQELSANNDANKTNDIQQIELSKRYAIFILV